MNRDLILSVTAKDCKFSYTSGSTRGGQRANNCKTNARCLHVESGAVGICNDSASQIINKKIAFTRMTKTKEFNEWHVRRIAELLDICDPNDLKVDVGQNIKK